MASTKTRQKEADPPKIKYLVHQARNESFVIEIPATWKVTFGWVNPGANGRAGGYQDGHCLRVWEGEKLRAVFDGVVRFRDLSIPFARKISQETGSATWTKDSDGNFESTEKRQLLEERFEPMVEEVSFD